MGDDFRRNLEMGLAEAWLSLEGCKLTSRWKAGARSHQTRQGTRYRSYPNMRYSVCSLRISVYMQELRALMSFDATSHECNLQFEYI